MRRRTGPGSKPADRRSGTAAAPEHRAPPAPCGDGPEGAEVNQWACRSAPCRRAPVRRARRFPRTIGLHRLRHAFVAVVGPKATSMHAASGGSNDPRSAAIRRRSRRRCRPPGAHRALGQGPASARRDARGCRQGRSAPPGPPPQRTGDRVQPAADCPNGSRDMAAAKLQAARQIDDQRAVAGLEPPAQFAHPDRRRRNRKLRHLGQ